MAVDPSLEQYILSHAFVPLDRQQQQQSQQDKRVRAATLKQAGTIPAGPVNPAFLAALAGCFAKTNQKKVSVLLDHLLGQSPTTASSFASDVLVPLLDTLASANQKDTVQSLRAAHLLASCCVSARAASLLAAATDPSTLVSSLRSAWENSAKDAFSLQYDILFASSKLLLAACPPATIDPDVNLDPLLEALTPAMDSASTSEAKVSSWLAELESEFKYSAQLTAQASPSAQDDPRFDYLVQILDSFGTVQPVSERLRHPAPVAQAGPSGSGAATKAKDKQSDAALDEAVAQVMAVLADSGLAEPLLRENLQHPRFYQNAHYDIEKFMSAFFDGDLPFASLDDVQPQGEADKAPEPAHEPEMPLDERTAFDRIWDESKIRHKPDQAGQMGDAAEEPMSADMKRSIIALAEATSDDEDEAYGGGGMPERRPDGMREVTLEEWEDEESGPPPPFRPAQADADDDDDDDGEDDAAEPQVPEAGPSTSKASLDGPFTAPVVAILSESYIEHGLDVLLRPNKTSKPTPARQQMMKRLQDAGWKDGEDLIQSWGRMLDRDPKKQRRLEPYQFSGNRPDSTLLQTDSQQGSSRRGQSGSNQRGGNRGGRGGPRGRGQNRGKNQRIKGHDRKMRAGM